jgi:hypothetical protein
MELRGRTEDLDQPRFPGVLAGLRPETLRTYGERHLSQTRIFGRESQPRFIDKMPNNFRYIGLIHLMLPNATIIDIRREHGLLLRQLETAVLPRPGVQLQHR